MTHLQDAKDRKDDEFYTRYNDIEKELGSYDWSNKIIEQYSIKNYFTKFLINYDPSKISFINL